MGVIREKQLALLISMSLLVHACGGGGAATDAVDTRGTTPEETPAAPPPPAPAPGPASVTVTTPGETFAPRVVNVVPGSTVTWQISGSRHNVTFASLQPAGGNIPDTDGGSASRVFTATGTYDYICTRHSGMTGQVIVGAGGGTGTAAPPPPPPPASGTLVLVTASGFSPERAGIAPGGTITWEFAAGADGIVFEDDAPPGGNIPQSPGGTRVSRTFPVEGDYDYHSLLDDDVEGRIRVR